LVAKWKVVLNSGSLAKRKVPLQFHKGLDKHKKTCQVFNMKSITLPKDRYFEFKNFKMYMQVYFKIFFRFLYLDSNVASGSTDMQIIAGYCIVIIDADNKIFD
jgi:hypothetical protein